VAWGNPYTEGSETAKVGTDEQEPDMRHDKTDEIAQLIDVPIPLNRESVCHVDPAAIDRRNMLLPGEIPGNREVSRGHSNFRKRAVKELRRSHKRDEGLNKHRSGI